MIVIQAGHVNIEDNIDGGLVHATGAPGERELTARVAQEVVDFLQEHRVSAMMVDANFNGSPHVATPYDAFIAVHFQSDTGEENGFDIGVMDPDEDGAAVASGHLETALAEQYEKATGLRRELWCQDNENVQHYYNFRSLAPSTPCVLIECSLVRWTDEDGNLAKIVKGITAGVLSFLGQHVPDAIAKNPILDALTNIGQTIEWGEELRIILDKPGVSNAAKDLNATMIETLHTARKLLAGE